MGIQLFEHNQKAYNSVVAMLKNTGKAAVIHPTGTGKSFIGFKFCEDHPNKTICWLSPSEYIFKTQIENLKAVSDGYVPKNINFFTYAKLMNLTDEQISDIRPDYIILDEFHRAGAQHWGTAVKKLLDIYPHIPLVGLSATHIRYLDNQRDMAEEIFDGNIASEMTLGEAIVCGILNPPKYILSVYSFQKDLNNSVKRIKKAKNKATQDEAVRYLELLRRALDKAEGLDVIFDRHMPNRTGKYIVFCANYEHLCEMKGHMEWFERVDPEPHVYTVYTEDPSASKSFQAFKDDHDDTHLRLLYAIDALNEGIHVDNISGVILLRPTISPVIYKQQIGRALSVSKGTMPVVFDIVNNIENLYSIDGIKNEIQNAVLYFRSVGMDNGIVNDSFQIIDEIKDCRILFDKLNDTLSSSWDVMYEQAKQYYERHHNLDVPKQYKTKDGYSLGSWLMTQRRVYAGEVSGRLSQQQIHKLDTLGMCWDKKTESMWKRGYFELCKFKSEYGNLDIKSDYITPDGFNLGTLVTNIRTSKVLGRRSVFLTPQHERELTELGFIWDKLDYLWDQNYLACIRFKLKHGHLDIPNSEISEDGLAIGVWVRRQRMIRTGRVRGRLTDVQIQRLNDIGFIWENHFTKIWNDGYARLLVYKEAYGNVCVPTMYVDKTGFALGRWLKRQIGNENIDFTRKQLLVELGVSFEPLNSWELRYSLAKQFYTEHGHLNIPAGYVADGVWISKWLNEQKQIYRGNRQNKQLTEEQIAKLEQIGMCWDKRTHL